MSHTRRDFLRHSGCAALEGQAANPAQMIDTLNALLMHGTMTDAMKAQVLSAALAVPATDALFARGLHLATSEFPWLAGVVPKTTQRCASEGLAALHPELPPEQIGDGLTAVLAHTFGLLTAFIGLDMTLPLVEQAWGVAASADDQSETTVTYE